MPRPATPTPLSPLPPPLLPRPRWVGKWIADDGVKRRISRFVMAPILFLAMMLNPVGLGLYLLLRNLFAGRR